VCAKHRGEGLLVGPVVWENDLVVVSHRPGGYPGYLFVESRRHVASLDELVADEVDAVGRAAWQSARGLRAELAPLFVFSAVVGLGVAHFHQHVFARHRGTPEDVGWMDGHQWAGAPTLPAAAIEELCDRLRRHFT